MKKTYWWRCLIFLAGVVFLGYGWLAAYGNEFGLCEIEKGVEECIFNYNVFIDPILFYSIFFLITSLILFFITYKIFLKWLRFAAVWVMLSVIIIIATPSSCGGWMPLYCLEKEDVSIWMGSLLLILSIAQIGWGSWKERKRK